MFELIDKDKSELFWLSLFDSFFLSVWLKMSFFFLKKKGMFNFILFVFDL